MLYRFDSPCGCLSYDWDGQLCRAITPDNGTNTLLPELSDQADNPVAHWLHAYFNGHQTALPPMAEAATSFQQRMRTALLSIPSGETRTYGQLAAMLNTAPRALGQALKANPLPILIPCHRIVAAHGPGGYAYGPNWKQKLLALEQQCYNHHDSIQATMKQDSST